MDSPRSISGANIIRQRRPCLCGRRKVESGVSSPPHCARRTRGSSGAMSPSFMRAANFEDGTVSFTGNTPPTCRHLCTGHLYRFAPWPLEVSAHASLGDHLFRRQRGQDARLYGADAYAFVDIRRAASSQGHRQGAGDVRVRNLTDKNTSRGPIRLSIRSCWALLATGLAAFGSDCRSSPNHGACATDGKYG